MQPGKAIPFSTASSVPSSLPTVALPVFKTGGVKCGVVLACFESLTEGELALKSLTVAEAGVLTRCKLLGSFAANLIRLESQVVAVLRRAAEPDERLGQGRLRGHRSVLG